MSDEPRCLVIIENWTPRDPHDRLRSLCEDFNIAADVVDDEYGIIRRWNDMAEREEFVFLTSFPACEELKKNHPGRFSGPHRAVIALTMG